MKPIFATLIAFSLCLPAFAQDKPKALGPIAGSGTGFFITADGYLLTNHHVVEGARDISIKTDKGLLPAKVVKVDKKNDLAVLKVEGKFAPLPLLSSRKVGLGEKVFTIGFPRPKVQGFSPKITDGIISSLAGIQDDPRDFQISVPVGPGNSGGPLVDQYGNVIGVIVSKLSAKYLLLRNRGDVDLPENVAYAIKGTFALGFMESLPRVAAGLKDPHSRDKERKFSVVVNEVQEATVPVLVGSYVPKVKIGTPIWEYKTGADVTSSPAIGSDGTVYAGSYDNKLHAINGKSGIKLWEFGTGGIVVSSPAIGSDGTVYVGSKDNKLYAINGKSGVKLWEFETGGDVHSSPAIGSDGTVYVGSHDYKLYAINGKSGLKVWEFETGNEVHSSPAIGSDGTVYVGSKDNKLYAINGKSGDKLWEFETGGGVFSSPAIGSDGTVYVGSLDKKLYAINGKSGIKLWEFETGYGVGSSPAIGSDGTVYVGSDDKKLYAINGKSGVKLWEFETGDEVFSSPAIGSDGTVYVGSWDNKLYAINGKTGVKLWAFEAGDWVFSSPAIGSDGIVYVGADDNKLYAIKTDSKGLAKSPWPMRGQNPLHTGRVMKKK
jgi:outer membrane protein assembly factor BamB